MPFCSYCGTQVGTGVAVCPECGHPQGTTTSAGGVPSTTGEKRNEGTAVASLALGIAGLVACLPVIGSLLGIVLGIIARGRIKKDPSKTGEGLALGGIITGAAGMVILPVLIAIAIPTFLGARERAQDRAAESALRNSLTAAKAIYTDRSTYRDVNVRSLSDAEPSLRFIGDAPSIAPGVVSFAIGSDIEIQFAALSASGKCIAVRDVAFSGSDTGTTWAERDSPQGGCRAADFDPADFTSRSLDLST